MKGFYDKIIFGGRACILLSCSFIFLDSDLLHCLMWHFSLLLLCFSTLVPFTSSISAFVVFLPFPLHCSPPPPPPPPLFFSEKFCLRFSSSHPPLSTLLARVLRGKGYVVVMVEKKVPLAYWRTALNYRNSGRIERKEDIF